MKEGIERPVLEVGVIAAMSEIADACAGEDVYAQDHASGKAVHCARLLETVAKALERTEIGDVDMPCAARAEMRYALKILRGGLIP